MLLLFVNQRSQIDLQQTEFRKKKNRIKTIDQVFVKKTKTKRKTTKHENVTIFLETSNTHTVEIDKTKQFTIDTVHTVSMILLPLLFLLSSLFRPISLLLLLLFVKNIVRHRPNSIVNLSNISTSIEKKRKGVKKI